MIALAILRRLLVALVTLAGVAVVVFVLLRVVPGDPIAMMISPGASQADIAALRAHYGLDGSLLSQFAVWVRYALRGDFGTSISLHRDVLALLGERLPATLELATAALEFAIVVGGAVAILSGVWMLGMVELRRHYLDLFRATLAEGSNAITLVYHEMTGPTARATGTSATVGVQNETRSAAAGEFDTTYFTSGAAFAFVPLP